ncbi:pyocin knob domain-containing protein [Fusobacterium pseudoperiodonticum]|uniref:pyocin knob domain-containing protein n=1 Tax=Fusobacterium pseudoperiodonticum TaxID=2663009 RepID=UPI001D03FBE5|nr:pyocin knob domain-containing protein [Fusobacterium pseudoperiodonticum]
MAEWINDPQGREEIEKVTKELKLPVWKANYKGKFRDFWNELWDKIEDYILKLKGDTEKNSKGLNDRLISAVGKHDGDFPIANAVVGNVYYSELTKKYYKCKVAGPAPMPNGNFIDMSILENLNRLENLYTTKEEKTKLSLTRINNVNLNNITEAGFYTSSGWANNISGLPQELNNNGGKAFYLVVFSLENGGYCQQILYSFKGIIFYRAITEANTSFNQWRKIG